MLIRAYGEFWDPESVDWGKVGAGNKGKLEGRFGPAAKPTTVDVWDQRGIYVLHHDWRVVYVGKTGETSLGSRIRTHLADGLAGRWDSFSWYGVRGVAATGRLTKLAAQKNVKTSDVIASFEALLIAVTEPPQNRRKEAIPRAKLLVQGGRDRPRPVRSILEEMRRDLKDVARRLGEIEGEA